MESDERFKHLASDPRFKKLVKRKNHVVIDDRFKSITEEKFSIKNKRGRTSAIEKVDPDPDPEDEDEDEDEDKDEDEDDISEDGEEVLSSSSDESDDNDDNFEEPKVVYDWKPLDDDAETAEITTKRLAIQNLDWDHLDVKDIYILVNSIRPPLSVKIYVSEFGKERLKNEELEGPREIIEMSKVDEVEEEYNLLKDKMKLIKNPGAHKVNEYEDADEGIDPKNEEIREQVRKYQLSRMRYYYAVAEFDSVESAELVYKELDGMEYEGSSLELDLRFVPDEIEFDSDDVKAECNKLPDWTTYQAPQFINSALQQTTVKFTWDQTDSKRQAMLHRAYTKEELEKDDLAAYLASETESESEIESGSDEEVKDRDDQDRIDKYKTLLKNLEEEADKKKKIDVDVEWGNFDEEESELIDASGDQANTKALKKPRTDKSRQNKSHKDEELDLLVMDEKNGDNFEFNPDDNRFNAIYESGLYNIDPSHPKFKRTKAFDMVAEKKRQKRRP